MNSLNSVHSGQRERRNVACRAFVWLHLQVVPLISDHVTSSSLNLFPLFL